MRGRIPRRTFLGLMSAGVFVAALSRAGSLLRRLLVSEPGAAVARPAVWRAILPAPRNARVVGTLYLRAVPEEADPDLVIRRLETALGAGAAQQTGRELRTRLRQRIRLDFEVEDTIHLEGWVLSRTESRLCALAVLL